MKITMIRHTAVDVPKGTCYGQTDVPLKDTFPLEAMIVATQLASRKFDAVYTSPLSRCKRLAHACGYAEAICDDRLMEINFGQWEMQPFHEINDPRYDMWLEDFINVQATDGESFMDQRMRLLSFFDDLKASGCQNVAIFTHGGIIMQTLLHLELATLEEVYDHQPPFGGIIQVEI